MKPGASKSAAEDGASYSDDMPYTVVLKSQREAELEKTLHMVISAIPKNVKAGMAFTLAEAERTLKGGE